MKWYCSNSNYGSIDFTEVFALGNEGTNTFSIPAEMLEGYSNICIEVSSYVDGPTDATKIETPSSGTLFINRRDLDNNCEIIKNEGTDDDDDDDARRL
jgi:hypothetical protein